MPRLEALLGETYNNVYVTARSKHPNLQVKCRGTKKDVISDENLQKNHLAVKFANLYKNF